MSSCAYVCPFEEGYYTVGDLREDGQEAMRAMRMSFALATWFSFN